MMLIIGATGAVGSRFVASVRNRENLRCLVRKTTDTSLLNGCNLVYGTPSNKDDVLTAAEGCEAILNFFPTLETRTMNEPDEMIIQSMKCVLAACNKHGIKRVVSVTSSTGPMHSPAEQAKNTADQLLKASDVDWTILHTGFVYGPAKYGILRYADLMQQFPFIPVVGHGQQNIQPVLVHDVVKAIQQSLKKEQSIRKTYTLESSPIALEHFIDTLAAMYDVKKRKIHVPASMLKLYAFLTANSKFLNMDMIDALLYDSHRDASQIGAELGVTCLPFDEGLKMVPPL
ncbi:MAG: NAD(P)H-binding protein [Candidatus Aenigmarchaeota archaeon]|nr:NAD(P)H-binding protein [Candidatus Aenigmarchaeota archaeon]